MSVFASLASPSSVQVCALGRPHRRTLEGSLEQVREEAQEVVLDENIGG